MNSLNLLSNSSQCGLFQILGGNQIFSNKTALIKDMQDLPFHSMVRITFFFMKIDRWEKNSLYITVDEKKNKILNLNINDDGEEFLCGNESIPEAMRPIDIIYLHNSHKIHIEISTDLDSPFGSWGIYNLSVYLSSCPPGNYMDNLYFCKTCENNDCKNICPEHYYFDSNNFCSLCHSSCKNCTSSNQNSCLNCNEFEYLFNGTCGKECPQKTYKNNQSMKCEQCPFKCDSCQNYNHCDLCQNQYYLADDFYCYFCTSEKCKNDCPSNEFFFNFTCVKSCPQHYYSDSKNYCLECHNSCEKCNGSLSNNCLECPLDLIFYENSCLKNCPINTYLNTSNVKECSFCHPSCSSCTGSENNQCLNCAFPLFLYENSCLSQCPEKYYKNNETNKCLKCNSLCKTCLEPYTCESCPNGSYLEDNGVCQLCTEEKCQIKCNQTEFKFNYTCLDKCPSHYFSDINNLCLECDISCKTCDKASEKNCLSCNKDYFLLEGQCVIECPSDMFKDYDKQECVDCHYSCMSCNGPNLENCTSCEEKTRIFNVNNNMTSKNTEPVTGICSCLPSYYDEKGSMYCFGIFLFFNFFIYLFNYFKLVIILVRNALDLNTLCVPIVMKVEELP